MMNFVFTRTPLSYLVASFWRDEAFSYLMAKLPFFALLTTTAKDSNPPLYYLILKIWMSIFGTSELSLRTPSLLFYWALLYVVYLILHELFHIEKRKATYYLLFVLLNPLLHYYAFETRMYTMSAFLGTLLFYFLLKKNYRAYAVTALIALYTHYFLALVIAFHVVWIGVFRRSDLKRFAVSLGKSLAWFAPWIIIVLFSRPPVGNEFWIKPPETSDLFFIPSYLLTGYEKNSWEIAKILPYVSFLVWGLTAYFGFVFFRPKRTRALAFLYMGWVLGIPLLVFFVSFFKPVFLPRYLIFSSVGLVIVIVAALETIGNKFVRFALLFAVSALLVVYGSAQVALRTKEPLDRIFSQMRGELGKNDVVYVTNEFDFHPAQYYLPHTNIYIYKKTYEEIPWFVGKALIAPGDMRSSLPAYPARAFILNNGDYVIQSLR